jgi:hypothetical protein
MILSTLFCHAAAMWPAHWVRSVMTLIIVMVIDASFESAAGFASRGGARVHGLVGVMSRGRAPENGGGQIAGGSDVQRRAPAPVFAPWRR